ncbi:MAG: sodium/glutamate symporter [Peptoniphilaceae bacterium]|nr:sodium/glutamate symporter [Peptoniphilaceae bacterium]MDY6085918.1 sodium/glutamate symporter [Peptoniphilaceae bacterium]
MDIISYFGTYDQAAGTYQFEYLTTLGFAAIVIFLGRFIVSKSAHLRKYAIPAPVVSGILFSIIVSIINSTGTLQFSFDTKILKDLAQNIFFMCIGYGFSMKLLKRSGGKLVVNIAVAACLLITLQNVLGVTLGKLVGLHPLLSLQVSSAAMSGGVGTASAFGPIFENMGAADATTIGVAAGTMGNIMGSLIGGPVGAYLIHKHNLKSDPNDIPEDHKSGKVNALDGTRLIYAFAIVLLACALGMPIYMLLDNIPMIEMPKFIGCLFAGAIVRNVMEETGREIYLPEVNALEDMWLELYLALVLMSIDFTKLAPVAGQMGIILLAQGIFIALFAIFVSFRMFGKDYGAAVMAAGNVGWGCGSGSNAVANERALMQEYGYHNTAWILYPSWAVIVDDIFNPIFLSLAGSFLANWQ